MYNPLISSSTSSRTADCQRIRDAMAADPHVPKSPLTLPRLDDTTPSATPTQKPPNGHKSVPERVAKTKAPGKGKVTVSVLPRLSLSLPASRPVDERLESHDPSPVRRESLLRRRSGDFSLPVRYKYVVIPGNNSRAVLAAFRRRPWWGPARKEDNTTTAAVVRSSNAPSQKRSMKGARGGGGGSVGYSNKTFNLWWEMYASRPVIEGTNLDANVRQAVNHFEFNAALVSKKGLWQSLRAYCASGGIPTLADVVPKTFYLSGGAFQSSGTEPVGVDRDERAEFLAYCMAMDTQIKRLYSTAKNIGDRPREEAVTCSRTLPSTSSIGTPRPLRPRTPNVGAISKNLIDEGDVCVKKANGGNEIPPCLPQDHSIIWEVGDRHVAGDAPANAQETCQPPAPGSDVERNGVPVHSGSVSLKFDNVRLQTGAMLGENTDECIKNQDGSRGDSAEGCRGEAKDNSSVIALGGAAGGTPTWVVKPGANSNCGFGIHICCSLKEVLDVVDAPGGKPGRSGWVVQRYIERPLLVRGRKFDIRLFVLVVADPSTRSWRRRSKSAAPESGADSSRGNDHSIETRTAERVGEHPSVDRKRGAPGGSLGACPLTAWCHQDAYVRTSSVKYSNDPSKAKDRFVHLTNNAVQRRSPSYGQDEPGNKLSLADLQDWLDGDGSIHKGKATGWVDQTLRPRMNALVATSVAAAAQAGMNKRGRPYAFELLGYDFMVDDDLQVWLIEVNSNPCLEFVCPLLRGMIGRVIDDTLSVALDPVFRPPEKHRTPSSLRGGESVAGLPGFGFSKVYPAT